MRPQYLQRLLKSQSEVLSRLYAECLYLKSNRKFLNEWADTAALGATQLDQEERFLEAAAAVDNAIELRQQGASYTKPLNKLKKRIAGLEAVQKELKEMLKSAQALEVFAAEDDAFWRAQESAAQEEGDAEPKGAVNIWFDERSGAWQV